MSGHLDETQTWAQYTGLDRRILKALSKLGYTYPTLVQSKCIPLALLGKDVLVRARTGMGKTHAFTIPLLHKLLTLKEAEPSAKAKINAIILVPTKELCKQIERAVTDLIYYCRDTVSVVALAGDKDTGAAQKNQLKAKPDILIATPAVLVHELQAGTVDLSSVKTLVIDEADLVLSFGYSDDVNTITLRMPKIFQGFLMSATLSPELEKFKKVVLHNPVVLKLEESQSQGKLQQFYLESKEADKFLVLYVFIKLGLLQGKGLIFVNDINKAYKIKLFLQQFYVSAAVLNSEVPLNSRMHILTEFDRGVFDLLIATDSSLDQGEEEESDSGEDEETQVGQKRTKEAGSEGEEEEEEFEMMSGGEGEEEEGEEEEEEEESDLEDGSSIGSGEDEEDEDEEVDEEEGVVPFAKLAKGSKKAAAALKEKKKVKAGAGGEDYGVSRGIDFNNVAFVVNFDFPKTIASYTHRIGRTARAGTSGTALSFSTISDAASNKYERAAAVKDAQMLYDVRMQQPRLETGESDSAFAAMSSVQDQAFAQNDELKKQPGPLLFNLKELDSFRYRVEDTLRGVTDIAVKDFRTAELKQEILNSAKLKSFFAANPNDLKVLRHEKAAAAPIAAKAHLKHVPDYLVPSSMKSVQYSSNNQAKKKRRAPGQTQAQRVNASKSNDPLMGDADDAAADDYSPPSVGHVGLGLHDSTSGRKQWQAKHHRGAFNEKQAKKGAHRMAGSFIKSKAYK